MAGLIDLQYVQPLQAAEGGAEEKCREEEGDADVGEAFINQPVVGVVTRREVGGDCDIEFVW